MFSDDEIRERVYTHLEDYWGTAWGEAEWAAYQRMVDLILDPEQTQRHRAT